jgi:hypothetical protein
LDSYRGQGAQENCKVRGLVHFSAHTYSNGLYVLAENMDLTPSRQDFAVLLLQRPVRAEVAVMLTSYRTFATVRGGKVAAG